MRVARFIADQRTFYRVPHAFSCRLLAVREAWFYKWIKAPTTVRGQRRALLDEAVRQAFVASQGSYGSPRVYEDLIDPELPHPELLAGQGAGVVTLPVHPVHPVHPVPAAEEPVDDPSDEVQEPPTGEVPTAAAGTAEVSDPLPSSGAGCSLKGSTLVWRVSVNSVADSMRRQGLKGRKVKRNRGLTRQDRTAAKFPDLLKRDFTAAAANLRWVGDMTEIPTVRASSTWRRSWTCSRAGYWPRRPQITPTPSRRWTRSRWPSRSARGAENIRDVIFHTDRGSTYTASDFTKLCSGLHIRQSMGRVGSCFDNAAAESLFSTLEWEVLSRQHFRTKDQARVRAHPKTALSLCATVGSTGLLLFGHLPGIG